MCLTFEASLTHFCTPSGSDYENADKFLEPSAQQIRECITEYGVLPLASSYVKQNAPLVSSVLLYGPSGTGKTHISRSIAKASNAAWFDLSPAIIAEHATNKADVAKLAHMTFTAAKAFAPSVIYIDGIEEIFQKKAKKSTGNGKDQDKCVFFVEKSGEGGGV